MTGPIPARVAKNAATKWTADESGCWISTYSIGSHGYAQVGWQNRGLQEATTAHRAAWTFYHGPIPDGLTVDHTCFIRRCVNPDHLRLLSNRDNGRRTKGRDWPLGECVNGHPDDGGRVCGECHRQQSRDWARRKRAAV